MPQDSRTPNIVMSRSPSPIRSPPSSRSPRSEMSRSPSPRLGRSASSRPPISRQMSLEVAKPEGSRSPSPYVDRRLLRCLLRVIIPPIPLFTGIVYEIPTDLPTDLPKEVWLLIVTMIVGTVDFKNPVAVEDFETKLLSKSRIIRWRLERLWTEINNLKTRKAELNAEKNHVMSLFTEENYKIFEALSTESAKKVNWLRRKMHKEKVFDDKISKAETDIRNAQNSLDKSREKLIQVRMKRLLVRFVTKGVQN